jgi:hypothetical protein
MIEALHVGALLPATVGLCCTAASPRQRGLSAAANWTPAVVMTAAMADVALGSRLIPVVLWTVLLVAASVMPAVQLRRDDGRAGRSVARHATEMAVHRSLGTLLMGGLMLVMATPASGAGVASAAHHAGGGGGVEWMLGAASIAFVALSAWLLGRVLRAPQPARIVALEVVSMSLSVGTTAVALLV